MHAQREAIPVTHVLLVEDERSVREALDFMLRREGFIVDQACDGADAIERFHRLAPDLVLLDLMLPGLAGSDVCREIRRSSAVPIVILTARDSEIDKVLGLELGADDYVTKPFSGRELVARMRAVLRRGGAGTDQLTGRVLTVGPLRLDRERRLVTAYGRPARLSPRDFDLLEILMRSGGRALARPHLATMAWGPDAAGHSKSLDDNVRRIRVQIEPNPSRPRHLITVRGLGYRLDA